MLVEANENGKEKQVIVIPRCFHCFSVLRCLDLYLKEKSSFHDIENIIIVIIVIILAVALLIPWDEGKCNWLSHV